MRKTIRFIDMFAGIGGFREGFGRAGGFECVGYCERDQYALRSYIDESLLTLRENVLRIEPDMVAYEGKLCGCAIVELKQELSERDWNSLLDYISGQYSDGWREGVEQRDIPVADGILNVHFWQPDQKYPIVLDALPGQAPTVPRRYINLK